MFDDSNFTRHQKITMLNPSRINYTGIIYDRQYSLVVEKYYLRVKPTHNNQGQPVKLPMEWIQENEAQPIENE